MYLTTFMIMFMSSTGLILKFPSFSAFASLDLGMVRFLHNEFSVHFSLALGIMMITGIIMYLFPLMRKKSTAPMTPKVN